MLVHQNFAEIAEFPPKLFMLQVMNDLAKAYCFLWDRKDGSNCVEMTWKDLKRYYNKNSFRTNIRKLNTQGLLDYEESEAGITIELMTMKGLMDDE